MIKEKILKTQNIIERLKNENTAGYFYEDNCRINYDGKNFYCKDFIKGKLTMYNVTKKEAIKKILNSLRE